MPGQPITENQTGVFFAEQLSSSVIEAIHDFESKEHKFSPQAIREYSLQFDNALFKSRMAEFVRHALLDFKSLTEAGCRRGSTGDRFPDTATESPR